MSRKPLVDNERIIAEAEALAAHFEQEPRPPWGYMSRMIERELKNLRNEYEAALDGARIAGLDASIAEGDVLDEWKERCWQAEQRIAELEAQNPGRDEIQCMPQRELEKQYQVLVDTGKYSRFQIAIHLARFAEARCLVMYRQSGNEDMDMMARRIDKLADRIAELERAQREGQGTL